jgi:hypothetical protein
LAENKMLNKCADKYRELATLKVVKAVEKAID